MDNNAFEFMTALLRLMPNGMPGRLLLNVMEERGIDKLAATRTIQSSLDHGDIVLTDKMNLGLAEPTEPAIGITHTARGFALIEFHDRNYIKCSLQKSSIATDSCVWFGCDELGLKRFSTATGWEDIVLENNFPDGPYHTANTRMHLTRQQLAALMPHIQRFINTGDLEP